MFGHGLRFRHDRTHPPLVSLLPSSPILHSGRTYLGDRHEHGRQEQEADQALHLPFVGVVAVGVVDSGAGAVRVWKWDDE